MRKIFFLFLFLLLIPFSYSLTVTFTDSFMSESFNDSSYASMGWTFTDNGGGCNNYAEYLLGDYGFSNHANGTCISEFIDQTLTNFYYNDYTDRTYAIRFEYYDSGDDEYSMINLDETYGGAYGIRILFNSAGSEGKIIIQDYAVSGCTADIESGTLTNYTMIVKTTPPVYDFYVGNDIVCENVGFHFPYGNRNLSFVRLMAIPASDDQFFGSIHIGEATFTGAIDCGYPVIFCDNFNYNNSIRNEKDWNVYNEDKSIFNSMSPRQSILKWNGSTPYYISHYSDLFSVAYPIALHTKVQTSYYAPQFSTEFDITFNATDGDFYLKSYDHDGDNCIRLRFDINESAANISFYNFSNNEYYSLGISGINSEQQFKLITKFTGTGKEARFSFNTSFPQNLADIYLNGSLFAENEPFPYACDTIWQNEFVKENAAVVEIDDYYFYVGFDKITNTLNDSRIDVYIEDLAANTSYTGVTTTDLAAALADQSMWCEIGLCSIGSRYLLSIGLMFIMTLAIIMLCMQTQFQHPMAAVVLSNLFLMIFLTYIGLMQWWVIITMGLLGVGLSALYIKAQIS